MKIKISHVAGAFSAHRPKHTTHRYMKFIKKSADKWFIVQSDCVFSDHYIINGFRVCDTHVAEIENDIRTDSDIPFVAWGGKKPQLKNISTIQIEDYKLIPMPEFQLYKLTGDCKCHKFVFYNDTFYVSDGRNFKVSAMNDIPATIIESVKKVLR